MVQYRYWNSKTNKDFFFTWRLRLQNTGIKEEFLIELQINYFNNLQGLNCIKIASIGIWFSVNAHSNQTKKCAMPRKIFFSSDRPIRHIKLAFVRLFPSGVYCTVLYVTRKYNWFAEVGMRFQSFSFWCVQYCTSRESTTDLQRWAHAFSSLSFWCVLYECTSWESITDLQRWAHAFSSLSFWGVLYVMRKYNWFAEVGTRSQSYSLWCVLYVKRKYNWFAEVVYKNIYTIFTRTVKHR